jgi:50S ribosomal protein L16 3-hydroxylase
MAECVWGQVKQRVYFASRSAGSPIVSTIPDELFRQLKGLSCLRDAASLVEKLGEDCFAWHRSGSKVVRERVQADEALAAYAEGSSLYFLHVDRRLPMVHRLCRTIEQQSGCPSGSVQAQVFAAPRGSDIGLHYDHDDNINMLLRGAKEWSWGSNSIEQLPLVGAFFSELQSRAQEPLTAPSLESSSSVPGDVRFIPRGYWHQTQSSEESISITFAMRPPYALEVALRELATTLFPEFEECREFVWSAPDGTEGSSAVLKAKRRILRHLEETLDPQPPVTGSSTRT